MPKKLNNGPELGVITARYSDRGQKDESIEQQIDFCRAYAEANGITVVAEYADRAITGKTDRRPEFQRMLRHAEKRQFTVVIAYASNRIGRNMLNTLMYEERLAKLGIRTVYAKEEYGDNAAGRFALRSMMNVNQFYSENLAEDVKRGMRHNAQNCLVTSGSLPLGYKCGEDKKYILDPPNAAVVQEIFERVISGEQNIEIARDLNRRGIRTSQGNEWGKNSFHSILDNERYTGVYIYEDIRIEGGVPQIISKEMYLRVQDYIRTKKKPRGRHKLNGDYMLTGKLYCGECGSPMVGISGTSKGGKLHYYYICKKRRDEKNCAKSQPRRDWAEREVSEGLMNLLADDKMIGLMVDGVIAYAKEYRARSDIAILEAQLKETRKALGNIVSAIEQGIVTETTKGRLLELEAEQKRIENRLVLEQADVLDVPRKNLLLWFESFRAGDIESKEYQRDLIDNVLIAAYLYDDHFKLEVNPASGKRKYQLPFRTVSEIETSGAGCSFTLSCGAPVRVFLQDQSYIANCTRQQNTPEISRCFVLLVLVLVARVACRAEVPHLMIRFS